MAGELLGYLFVSILILINTVQGSLNEGIVGARIESCRACRLNRLPEVKAFIFGDVPSYENVVFKPIPGASPELILFDENEKELERLDLAPLNREECNSLLLKYGFQKKGSDVESNRIRDDF